MIEATARPGSQQAMEEMVERARRGDRAAYEHLALSAARRLYPVAYRILRDRDQADDALQRTLVAIWRELPKLRESARFDAWSYRLLVRFCSDELKRRRRMVSQVVEISAPDTGVDDATGVAVRDQLERGFRRLSADHRAVVVLVYYEGLSGAEAATVLGVTPGTVASRLHYALKNLRAALDADSRTPVPPELVL